MTNLSRLKMKKMFVCKTLYTKSKANSRLENNMLVDIYRTYKIHRRFLLVVYLITKKKEKAVEILGIVDNTLQKKKYKKPISI